MRMRIDNRNARPAVTQAPRLCRNRQAQANTDQQREELLALFAEAKTLAQDIIDHIEFFYRKDPDASSRRAKCERWGVEYVYEPGENNPPR